MPLKPTVPGTDGPKKFEDFSISERIDWIKQTRAELAGGVFGRPVLPGFIPTAAIGQCQKLFDELPAAAQAELQGEMDDLRAMLASAPERPPARARA